MYNAKKFESDPEGFREAFRGETAVLVNGKAVPVENLTDEEIMNYQIDAVTNGEVWATADKVATKRRIK
jgi:hypothetical protein